MNPTKTTQTIRSRLGARAVVAALVAVLLTACLTEIKTPTVTLAGVAAITTESTLTLTAIAAPATGSGFNSAGPAITKVELYDGTRKLDEKTVAPYVFEIKLTSSDNGKKQFKVKAHDQAGAVGESNTVLVDVNIPVRDTTPPILVSVDPQDGAKGVSNNKIITITFSEPMNQQSTQAAYQSVALPPSAVTFAWSLDGKSLNIKPNSPLEYKEVTNSSESAKNYEFNITNTATDLTGNKLVSANFAFLTLKKVVETILPANSSEKTLSDLNNINIPPCYAFCIGDGVENSSYRGFVGFDLSKLPKMLNQADILTASLNFAHSKSDIGKPFENLIGPCYSVNLVDYCPSMTIESVKPNPSGAITFDGPVDSTIFQYEIVDANSCLPLCILPKYGNNSINILPNLIETLKKDSFINYRFRLAKNTNSDSKPDYAYIGFLSVNVVYLFP